MSGKLPVVPTLHTGPSSESQALPSWRTPARVFLSWTFPARSFLKCADEAHKWFAAEGLSPGIRCMTCGAALTASDLADVFAVAETTTTRGHS